MTLDDVRELLRHARLADPLADSEERAAFWHEALEPAMTLIWAKTEVVRYYMKNTRPILPAHLNTVWHHENVQRHLIQQTKQRDLEKASYMAGNHEIPPHVRALLKKFREQQARNKSEQP